MKKMRLHIYILLGFFLTTFIIGSFLDLQISEAIYSKNNTFGLVMSIVGTLAGYSPLALAGGILFGLALTRKYHVVMKVLIYIASVVAFGLGVFFAGREFFGPNGFPQENLKWLGYVITLPFMCGAGFLGYYFSKNNSDRCLLNVVMILLIAIFLSLIPGVTLIKWIFHRPRFRTLSDPLYADITFHNWWQRCTNYKDLMALYNISSEEFKSFPSGHAGASLVISLAAVFLPYFDKRINKSQIVLFYFGFGWTILVAFVRILVGAHFLSDVSMGALLVALCMFVANEFVIFKKFKFDNKQEQVESFEE